MADRINLDYETASEIDLIKIGLDRYSAHESTRPLMCAWSVNGSSNVQHWDAIRQPKMPAELREAIEDPDVMKWAFNAQFERVISRRVMGLKTDYKSWRCTMSLAYMLSFAGTLDLIGKAVGLPQDKAKDKEGKRLINLFSKPQKITKSNNLKWFSEESHPEEWWDFCEYNKQDVVAETAIYDRLIPYDVLESEWQMYALDQYINDKGVQIDLDYARSALFLADQRKPEIIKDMQRLTGLDNPNSVTQLLPWLQKNGYRFDDMRADTIAKVLNEGSANRLANQVMELRQNSAKSSLAKYTTMIEASGEDGRFRFSHQFAGASRTNRWAGRRLQPQNVTRTPKKMEAEEDLKILGTLIKKRDLEAIDMYMGEPMEVLSGTIRSAIIPAPKKKFIVADLSSIESVVIGWVTGCHWFMSTLAAKKDLYRSFAAEWLKIHYDETKPHRGKAKPATLGAGYRLGGGHMDEKGKKTGLWGYAENMGVDMTQEEAAASVQAFRDLCPEIVQAWYDLEKIVFRVLRTKQTEQWRCLTIRHESPFLTIQLPSGRKMYYYRPKIVSREMTVFSGARKGEKYTKDNFQYEGKLEGNNKWGVIYSHGGKLIENIVQALARDVLCEGLKKAHRMGFGIVMHVHDEIVTEVDLDSQLELDDLIGCMAAEIPWAPGLPLGAAGWEGFFYRKD